MRPTNRQSDELTVPEVARALGVSPGRVRQFLMRGQLAATKRGRDNFITRVEFDRFAVTRGEPATRGESGARP